MHAALRSVQGKLNSIDEAHLPSMMLPRFWILCHNSKSEFSLRPYNSVRVKVGVNLPILLIPKTPRFRWW